VVLVMEVTDMDKFKAILNDPATVPLKSKHTVLDPITVSMQIEL
jgi:hypothetical protein